MSLIVCNLTCAFCMLINFAITHSPEKALAQFFIATMICTIYACIIKK